MNLFSSAMLDSALQRISKIDNNKFRVKQVWMLKNLEKLLVRSCDMVFESFLPKDDQYYTVYQPYLGELSMSMEPHSTEAKDREKSKYYCGVSGFVPR